MQERQQLSYKDAWVVVDAIRQRLEDEGLDAAVAVVDDHGELVAFLRTDGCRLSAGRIAINKAYTAAREQIESGELGARSREMGFPMTNFGELRYVTWGGGVPIRDGRVIGGVGVSGLPEEQDIEFARLGVRLVGPQ